MNIENVFFDKHDDEEEDDGVAANETFNTVYMSNITNIEHCIYV